MSVICTLFGRQNITLGLNEGSKQCDRARAVTREEELKAKGSVGESLVRKVIFFLMYEMKRWAELGKKRIVQMRGKKKNEKSLFSSGAQCAQ